MKYSKKIKVLEMIARDMEDDARKFDGCPLIGNVVAKYSGCQEAAIAALAKIIKSILEEEKEER